MSTASPMLTELQKCASLYVTTPENVAVMCRMTADAQKIEVCSVNADGKNFKIELDEAALSSIKQDVSWEKFFEDLQVSFNLGKVACSNGTKVEVSSRDDRKTVFNLEPTSDDCEKAILASLLNYHHINTHLKEIEKQLEETGKQEQDVRTQAFDLEKEEAALTEGMQRNKDQDEVNEKRLADLKAELARVEEEKRSAGGEELEEEDDELTICRTRIPLGEKDHKDYDPELLRLVKADFTKSDQDASMPFHAVCRPYTTDELTQQTKTFSSQQRELIYNCLQHIDQWDYDVFTIQQQMSGDDNWSLAEQKNGGSLMITMYALLFRHGCMQRFKIDEKTALNWLSVVEAGYHPNPYHNSMHAADVLHVTHYILHCGGLIKKCSLSPEDTFAALFAAAIHDYDHPGINNSFHIKAQTYLAVLYNDRSVLENRHVSSVFELMKLPKFNVLSSFTEDQKRDIRDTVIEMVLATDMGLHAKFVGQFKRRLAENHDFTKKDDIRLALAMALKMADISNCGRPNHLYLKWSNKIADEFYMQGDRERNLGMPCSPFMDRTQPAMAKGQIAFMNYIVIPLFECISEFIPDMHFSVDHTDQNKTYWVKNDDSNM